MIGCDIVEGVAGDRPLGGSVHCDVENIVTGVRRYGEGLAAAIVDCRRCWANRAATSCRSGNGVAVDREGFIFIDLPWNICDKSRAQKYRSIIGLTFRANKYCSFLILLQG